MLLVLVTCGFRMVRPDTFSEPWNEGQIERLNDILDDVYYLQQGNFNFDIETTTKTRANNGDLWFIQTAGTVYIQYKANDHIFTITPDGF